MVSRMNSNNAALGWEFLWHLLIQMFVPSEILHSQRLVLLLRLDTTYFHIVPTPRGFIALYPVCLNLEYSLINDKAR